MLNYADAVSALGLFAGRVTGSVVGRPQELAALEQGLNAAQSGMACLALEGEPGIGKTRLLLAAEELARGRGFATMAVTADEEIQGPFLVARSIFASPAALEAAEGTRAEQALQRVVEALSNRDEPGLDGLAPDRKLLRVFDLAALALRTLAAERPLAVLVDDLQWADEDSLRLLRYVVRVGAASPILLVLSMRASEIAFISEAVTLLADIERIGILRRVKLSRFSQLESTELLQQVLGAQVNLSSAAIMHAQAEGVPFVLAEQAHAYRDTGLIQQIDGVWTLARNAERLMPSAVQTLIRRRGAHLTEETKASLSEAAVLGRTFSLRDLREVKLQLRDEMQEVQDLAASLAPAVASGLLVQLPQGSAADYSFTHEQVRQYAIEALAPPRRRAVHAAIVEMLTGGGDAPASCLTMVAQHALAAGQTELAARTAIKAASAALEVHAPEEVLRLADLAHPVTSSPQDRVALLRLRDDALHMLRRPTQRLEGLAELGALAEALGDSHLELDVLLRRAAALRLSQEQDRAAELARRVQQLAAERHDVPAQLDAWLELGQDLLHVEMGEGYAQAPTEADLEGAAEAYEHAVALAEELNDQPKLAAANRELGIIGVSQVRSWFLPRIQAGEHIPILQRIAAGERLEDILPTSEIAPVAAEAGDRFRRALEIYERIGDRQGAMTTIIGMAFVAWGPEIHLQGSAKRIEELRSLMARLKSLTTESERAVADAQMLFGAHVYSRAKVFPDNAIAKGKEAYDAARSLGDHSLEFAIAGGLAMSYAEVDDASEAERWLARAATIASTEPTPLRARQLESWRGYVAAAAGDADAMREHLSRAVQLATDQGRPAARCEALARLALEAARLGAENKNEDLLALAERSAEDAKALAPILPGHPPWGAQAHAALARVALARGDVTAAAKAGREALSALDNAMREDPSLEILLPAADAILTAGEEPEATALRDRLRLTLALIAQRILDEDVRVHWFRGPIGRELTRLADPLATQERHEAGQSPGSALADEEVRLLRLLTQGRTNQEIAEDLGESEASLVRRLAELFVKIGATSRADATATAMIGKLV